MSNKLPKDTKKLQRKALSRQEIDFILQTILKQPKLGLIEILRELKANFPKRKFSQTCLQNLFLNLSLNTRKKRLQFVKWASKIDQAELFDLIHSALKKRLKKELAPAERLVLVRLVDRYQVPVSQACRLFSQSRRTFYKWYQRYHQSASGQEYQAVCNVEPAVKHYWRQAKDKQVKAVLKIVQKHPEYSTHKVAEALPKTAGKPILGNHGVQNVFKRLNLNTHEKRLAYVQEQAKEKLPLLPIFNWLKPDLKRVFSLFALPPPSFKSVFDKIKETRFLTSYFIFGFINGTLISIFLLSLIRTVIQAPSLPAQIGLVFSFLSLIFGIFFLIYSLKYYFTLAIVLSFSRRSLVNDSQDNRGEGLAGNNIKVPFLAFINKVFGLEIRFKAKSQFQEKQNSTSIPSLLGPLPSVDQITLKRYPFISIHLPLYNEKRVALRLLKACTKLKYPASPSASRGKPHFEIIVCDDSTDETTAIVKRFAQQWNNQITNSKSQINPHPEDDPALREKSQIPNAKPLIKVLHRDTREGFKGGALRNAMEHMDKRTEFVCVFDADFVPYPDTLELFVKNFKAYNHNSEDYQRSKIAVVGGYQWHVLNKSENWITRGVRTEYSGSYVIERAGGEILGLLKQISGSVYMVRADLLKEIGWGKSITEDFQLTLKLYEQGYKVVYTPYIQAPAECVSTLKRLIRQRMRWAEGHSFNIKRMFKRMIASERVNLKEKLEFLYLSPYYFQAFLFLLGTLAWIISEGVFRVKLPFWTALWGWSLVFTNFLSLPLMNAIGLFLEEAEEKDYLGILSFIGLSYILAPFQAYASLRGFLKDEEGPWFRTPKTGRITDIFKRGKFYRWVSGIIPGWSGSRLATSLNQFLPQPALNYLTLRTGNNRFNQFRIFKKTSKRLMTGFLVFLLIFTLNLIRFIPLIPSRQGSASPAREQISIAGKARDDHQTPSSTEEKVVKEARESQQPSLVVEEHNAWTDPQDFYLGKESLELSLGKDNRQLSSSMRQTMDKIKAELKDMGKIKKAEAKEKEYLPYYSQETEEGYRLYLKSEKGIQRYEFKKDNPGFWLAEEETGKEEFVDQVWSRPVFQYQDQSGQWKDYEALLPLDFKLEEFGDYLILLSLFELKSQINSQTIKGEIELKLGLMDQKQISKLTFRLGENSNLNRLVWETKVLEESLIEKDEDNLIGLATGPNGELKPAKTEALGNIVIDWQDYPGETRCEQDKEENLNRVYFYESGLRGGFEIDPTLTASWSGSILTVTSATSSPSWRLEFRPDVPGVINTNYFPTLFIPYNDSNPTAVLLGIGNYANSLDHWGYEDTGGSATILEESATRVVVRSIGTMDSSGETATNGSYVVDWTITPYNLTIKAVVSNVTTASDNAHLFYSAYVGTQVGSTRYVYDDDSAPSSDNFSGIVWWVALPAGMTYDKIGSVLYEGVNDISINVVETNGLGAFDRQVRADFTAVNGSYAQAWGDDDIGGTNTFTSGDSWSVRINFSTADTNGTYARGLARDQWNPDDLSDSIGTGTSGWFDTDENTVSSADFWNEEEGFYCLQGTMGATQFAQWDIDGGTYTRYKSSYKIRGWRSTSEPSVVTLEGAGLADGTNYNMDIAPFSEAWVFDDDGSGYKKLSDGGDNDDADEYLNDTTNDWDFGDGTYTFGDSSSDYFYLGSHDQFTGVNLDLSTVGSGSSPVITWQYCSSNADTSTACDSWSSLSESDTDAGASNMTASGNFYFADPAGWVASTENSGRGALWWIRGYVSSGSFTTEPVENFIRTDILLLQYLSDISSDNQTFVMVPENLWPFLIITPFIYKIVRRKKSRRAGVSQ